MSKFAIEGGCGEILEQYVGYQYIYNVQFMHGIKTMIK
jgi:hypothetical protein